MTETIYLNRDEVFRLAADIDVEDAIRRILIQSAKGIAGQHVRTELSPRQLDGVLGIMPAFRAEDDPVFSAKVVCVIPSNPERGLPAHQGMVLLFDASDGHLRGFADAGAVTEIRTAAQTALATRTLARIGSGRLLIVGAGHQAAAHARALSGLGWRLSLWARRVARAEALAQQLAAEGIVVEVVDDLESGVRQAAVVTTTTGTAEPFIHADWLRPDAHWNAIGSSTPRVNEVPAEVLHGARIFVDDVEAVSTLSGEMQRLGPPLPHMTPLGEVLADPGRFDESWNGRTVFKSVGVPVQDLALVTKLVEAANRRQVGQRLTLTA
ncbi:ornithine cyclodeaminase [Pseudoclavibacter endophyticus]|uniref:ornithine cyclodeaminase family protein n=1 Tax=Pseudoclavibacter endophyticus TaxID=1778590 RepID=UPI0016633E57|nr:ornithine cyclodeaminase family protein [Pseudoclavibacter endophyticus]GGA70796.1 ornithine cyclodeaminase [Pseudoclavibacter endophyticus]